MAFTNADNYSDGIHLVLILTLIPTLNPNSNPTVRPSAGQGIQTKNQIIA